MARVPYLTREDLPPEYENLFEVDEEDPADVLVNVHRAMANNPRLLAAWSEWALAVYDEVGDARTRELAILAVARAIDSRYVWHQHAPLALAEGVSREEVLAVADRDTEGFSPAETAVLEYATAVATGSLDDTTHDELAARFDDRTVVALAFLATEYLQAATFIDALAVELDEEFVGWRLERLG